MAFDTYWVPVGVAVLFIIGTLGVMGIFSRKNHFDVDGRTVILTGGSQGMGRGLGRLLAQKGANVVIVARNEQKLIEALKYISSHAKSPQTQRFHSISADVTKPEESVRIINEATEWNHGNPPDIVWANAGSSHPELFVDTPVELLRSQMDINYWGAAYLAHATLKAWLRPSSSKSDSGTTIPRHFLVTSSVGCFVGICGYAPYAPAKAALRSLADNLRSEVLLYNGYRRSNPGAGPAADVRIHCVCPGTIISPGLEEENKTKHAVTKLIEETDPKQSEDEVAAAAMKGLEKGEFLITTQYLGHLMRASALGGSPRDNVIVDTVMTWVASIVWLFVGPDLDSKVYKYGQKNTVNLPR